MPVPESHARPEAAPDASYAAELSLPPPGPSAPRSPEVARLPQSTSESVSEPARETVSRLAPSHLELPVFPGPKPVPFLAKVALYARMVVAFSAALVVTFFLILAPWTLVLSPRLHATREARIAAIQPPPPRIIEVPTPVPVLVEVPAPAPDPEPVTRARPVRPRPVRTRPAPRPRPIEPAPAPQPEPKPVVAASLPASGNPSVPDATVSVKTVEPPTPAPVPETPEAAVALEGTLEGSSAGRSVAITLDFRPSGRVSATIDHGDETAKASGTYTLHGDRATIAIVESGAEGASYTGTVDSDGAVGRVTLSDGKSRRFRVKR